MDGNAPLPVLDTRLKPELERLREAHLYRTRRVIEGPHAARVQVDGRVLVNFCSNDYLGLAADPRPAAAAAESLRAHGMGSGASALICGYDAEHRRLEEALAEYTGYPRVLLFSSGWAANCGVLKALLSRGDTLLADELNHASLIDGGRLSGADYLRVPHASIADYAKGLEATAPTGLRLLVTDTVFSMDGDLAPLPALDALCRAHGAALMVDDAHGIGVLGTTGRGGTEACGVRPDVYVATFGKALGSAGAFVAGSEALIEYLIQRARSYVFSTAPPPALAAGVREALRIVAAEPERRERVLALVDRFADGARQLGLPLGAPGAAPQRTPIQPLVLGDEARTMAVSRELFERGFWVAGIRPPTVPRGTSRLRITFCATHTADDVDGLLDALSTAVRAAA